MEKLIKIYTLEIKKSKFIAYYYSIESKEDIDLVLEKVKQEHKNARHIPYAYKLTNTAKKSDDKEPNNTAGMPIFQVIERNNLKNSLILVVRYFGGTKLGSGLLTRSYSKAANEVIKK